MLVCNECNREECVDYCIIYNGQVLCLNCALQHMINKLERINKVLEEIRGRLDKYDREGKESKG